MIETESVPVFTGRISETCPKCNQRQAWKTYTRVKDGRPLEGAGCDNCGLVREDYGAWGTAIQIRIEGW